MARVPNKVVHVQERRLCAILKEDDTEILGVFHKWTEKYDDNGVIDCALVEQKNGTMLCIDAECIRFLQSPWDIPLAEMEDSLNKAGIINGE